MIPSPASCEAKFDELCRYEAYTSWDVEFPYRNVAGTDNAVRILNLDQAVCPLLPICDPVVNGKIVKFDPSHLTPDFAKTLAPDIDASLKSFGFIPH